MQLPLAMKLKKQENAKFPLVINFAFILLNKK